MMVYSWDIIQLFKIHVFEETDLGNAQDTIKLTAEYIELHMPYDHNFVKTLPN